MPQIIHTHILVLIKCYWTIFRNHCHFQPLWKIENSSLEYEENCLFNHELIDENTYLCYECGEKFNTLSDLMVHRKQTHRMINCKKFLKNNCSFTSDKCWYTHKNDAQENDAENLVEMNEQKNEVFENNTGIRIQPPFPKQTGSK